MRTHFPTVLLMSALVFAGTASTASAQPMPVLRVMEIGANGSIITGGGLGVLIAGGPDLTFNLSSRHAVSAGLDAHLERYSDHWIVDGFYRATYRYTFVDRGDVRNFIVAGLSGNIEGHHNDSGTYTAFTRNVTVNGIVTPVDSKTVEYPAATRWRTSGPRTIMLGVGSEIRMAPRLAFRGEFDVTLMPYGFGVRAFAGLAVPIGHIAR